MLAVRGRYLPFNEVRGIARAKNPRDGAFAGAVRSETLLPVVHGIPSLTATPGFIHHYGNAQLAVAGGAALPVALIIVPV
jgi:hypothetical protein